MPPHPSLIGQDYGELTEYKMWGTERSRTRPDPRDGDLQKVGVRVIQAHQTPGAEHAKPNLMAHVIAFLLLNAEGAFQEETAARSLQLVSGFLKCNAI